QPEGAAYGHTSTLTVPLAIVTLDPLRFAMVTVAVLAAVIEEEMTHPAGTPDACCETDRLPAAAPVTVTVLDADAPLAIVPGSHVALPVIGEPDFHDVPPTLRRIALFVVL